MSANRTWILRLSAIATLLAASIHPATSASLPAPKIDATPFLGDHYPSRRNTFAEGVVALADVPYQYIPGFRPLTLDVYLPPNHSRRHPLVLYIHGGGWTTGHSRQSGAFDDFPKVLASLAARGYTVASLNYRLSSEAPFPAAIQDVKSAIKFLRAHSDMYGIDPAKGLVWGGSAGGHLAALAALTCGVKELEPVFGPTPSPEVAHVAEQSDCVQAAVAWYGVFDLSMVPGLNGSATASPGIRKFLDCRSDVCSSEVIEAASPSHYVKSDSPPFLLIHGSADKTVDPAQSKRFEEVMERSGRNAQLIIIPDVGHSFIGATPAATRNASLLALRRTFEFVDGTFKPRP